MTLREFLKGIADAIRTVEGSTGDIPAPTYRERILALSGGGGGGGDGSPYVVNIPVTISASVSVNSKRYPVWTSACFQNTGGTTLTGTIDAKAGAWVLATVTTRSATTYPDDWTLLHESTALPSSASNQRMAFLCKYVDTAETVSFTVSQASSARIYINLIAVTGCQGFRYHSGSENYFSTNATSFTVDRPDYDYVIWGLTANLWASSASYGHWTCSAISNAVIDLGTSVQSRQANFCDFSNTAETRTFTPNAGSGTCAIIDCVEVIM